MFLYFWNYSTRNGLKLKILRHGPFLAHYYQKRTYSSGSRLILPVLSSVSCCVGAGSYDSNRIESNRIRKNGD
jgi:hypothetical protein